MEMPVFSVVVQDKKDTSDAIPRAIFNFLLLVRGLSYGRVAFSWRLGARN